jgi:hypothetical protein
MVAFRKHRRASKPGTGGCRKSVRFIPDVDEYSARASELRQVTGELVLSSLQWKEERTDELNLQRTSD